jgi:hypothetical protein
METKNVEKLQIVTNIFLILFCTFSMFVMTLAEIRHNSNVTPTTGTAEIAPAATGTPTATDKKETTDKKDEAVKTDKDTATKSDNKKDDVTKQS